MKRRDALKTLGGLAGAAAMTKLLPACNGDDGPVGITTYVFLMMENRSYDHVLGARSLLHGLPGDGLTASMTNRTSGGEAIAPYPATAQTLCDVDPPHGWDAAHAQFNGGLNDGFVIEHQERTGTTGTEPMKYLTRDFMPVSWALADEYTTCDRWFCSVMGPTWPNRFYWHTGTSGGIMVNELPGGTLTWPSINHRLHEAGVDWRYYFGNIPVASLLGDSIPTEGKILRYEQFLKDAKAGKLAPVSYIDPAFFLNDDHPPIHPINGQELIASIYNALATSPQWKNCLLVVTYDENGGYFDHVPPPTTADDHAAQGFDQLGFRVPTMVIGPYVKQGHVSNVQYDHTSVLKHVEETFALAPLTARSSAANNLLDCIDLARLEKGEWAPPIELPLVDIYEWEMGPECSSSERSQPSHESHPVLEWAARHPDLMERFGARTDLTEYRREIRHFLRESATKVSNSRNA